MYNCRCRIDYKPAMPTRSAKDKKARLEKDIQTLIESYEEDTGTTVQYLDLERVEAVKEGERKSLLVSVDAEVQL